jgi:pyruvate/2-oxoglutarate dehydrogenase complex dihydrolipoamide dehydrogenase (E3) component
MAVGRRPALGDLGLDLAGVDRDERGLLVLDPALRTTNEHVWAVGDAAGGMMQTPVASYEGRTVAASIDRGTPIETDYSTIPTTVFTVPQLGQVGRTEAELESAGIPYRVGLTRFDIIGAGIIADERDCLVKLLFGKEDGRLLGAHVAAPDASDIVYGLAMAMRAGATEAEIRDTIAIHPSFSEAVNWAAW